MLKFSIPLLLKAEKMALTQKAKQAKALKKNKKRKAQLKQKSQKSNNMASIAMLRSGSIHECFVSEPQGTNPFYSILISRINNTSGNIIVAHFLIEPDCNGVEDVILSQETTTSFQNVKSTLSQEHGFLFKPTHPAIAKKFIISAVDHAKSFGFMPHPDYHAIKEIFFDVDETTYSNVTFQFG
jgi:hypothetical protein